jgi:hypothetical protein
MNKQTSRIRRFAAVTGPLVGALMLAALTACGAGGGGSDDDTPAPATSAEPTTALESTEETPVPEETTPYLDPSLGETTKPGALTISGTVEEGVEAGCLVLEYEGTVYGIFGNFDSAVVYAGASVTLQGKVDEGMMSTCQQGTPFVVEEAQTAD